MQLLKNSLIGIVLLLVIAALVIGYMTLLPKGGSQRQSLDSRLNVPKRDRSPRRPFKGNRQRPRTVNPALNTYEIMPQATDRAIDNWLEPHYVALSKTAPPQKRLFLFFAGSNGRPDQQKLIVDLAAELGIHAINLRYPNSWTVASLCGASRDRDCHEQVRLEILDGVDRTAEISVNQANSIENRLVKLLRYLHGQHPDQGWLEYLEGDNPKWESIIVAGHSQGGGQAALIAKQHQVARVIMLGAPADYSRVHRGLAPWLTKPSPTPVERYYGFVHTQDPAVQKIKEAWKSLGMDAAGAIVNVDTEPPPYQGSQQLTTSANPAQAGKYHGSVATDRTTPRLPDGQLLFADVWRYLITGN